MKKILFLGAMAAMLLGTASCSNEVDQPAMGDEVNAAFRVNLDGIESRTISDGLTVNELYFEVYEAKTEGGTTTYTKLPSLSQKKVAVANKTATVTTKLIKGKTYKFAFWAQKDGAYIADDLQNIAMNYTNANANDENRDAFFANVEKTVTAAFEEPVTLYRPFAQINFGASDVDAAMDISGFTSQLVVKKVPNQFNVLSGVASGEEAEVTLAATAVPARIPETLKVDGKDYTYISMNYILATPENATKDITLKVMDGTTEVKVLPVSACPMQRNYRTNILGDILSVEGKFNITINPIYNGDHNIDPEATVFNVTSESELTEALKSEAKKIYINLLNDVQLSYGARVAYGNANTESITIDGYGHTLNLKGTDTDWSSFGAAGNGDFTLKNMTINKTEPGNGAWNNHAINISNKLETGKDPVGSGKIYLQNLKINNSVSISNDAVIENVDFYEEGHYYGLMIKANVANTTVNNCTFIANVTETSGDGGRGIKVIDQYVDVDKRVQCNIIISNCTFETIKKAAILVTNTAGAKITASNLDISKVAADPDNAVWNDSNRKDAWDLVEVTGCTKKQE